MPKFLLPILILSLVSLSGFGFVVLRMSPDQNSSVILFLLTLFLSLVSVLSVLLFFIHKKFFFTPHLFPLKKGAGFNSVVIAGDLRSLFRTSLRNAILLAVVVIVLLVLGKLV